MSHAWLKLKKTGKPSLLQTGKQRKDIHNGCLFFERKVIFNNYIGKACSNFIFIYEFIKQKREEGVYVHKHKFARTY